MIPPGGPRHPGSVETPTVSRRATRRVWGVGGVVPMAAGGMGFRTFTASCSFCSAVFCMGFKRGKGSESGCWLLLGSAMGPRCAC